MTEDRLVESLFEAATGEENTAVSAELQTWATLGQTYAAVVHLTQDREALDKELALYRRPNPDEAFARWQTARTNTTRVRFLHFTRRQLLVAAIVLPLIVVSSFFIVKLAKHRDEITTGGAASSAAQTIISPGRNTAILILSDGREILLDSAKPGQLALEADTRVMKTDTFGVVYLHSGKGSAGLLFNTLKTPRSGQYQVMLPDGSRVWLNDESKLRYPASFDGKDRTVELTGEAYFELARDADKPFKVKLRHHETIQAVGTSFDIMAYPDEDAAKTTLLTGAIQVRTQKSLVELKPREQARIDSAGMITVLKDMPVDDIASWKNGHFYFDGSSIKEVMRQLARWYDIDIVYVGDPGEKTFAGKIRRDVPLNQLLQFFKRNHIQCRLDGRRLIVLSN